MLNKIDPQLLYLVKTSDNSSEHLYIECIVYANNYLATKNFLQNNLNIKNINEYPFIFAFGVKVQQSYINEIAMFNDVSYISYNFKVKTLINVSKKVLNIKQTKTVYSKNYDFTVAVIDTGVAPILDLCVPTNRIVHSEDFVNGLNYPYDDNGHGTFIASIMSGNGLVSGTKYAGIDKNNKIISLKALDENGETGAMTILKAMQWVYDNKKKYNIKVVCMSFGSNIIGKRDPLVIGAEVLWSAGVVVVSAAGNSGPEPETIRSPGAASKIITVGALNDNRNVFGVVNEDDYEVADFSSRGPAIGNYKPDLIAPGVGVKGACNFAILQKHYTTMEGTSISTPMVAGVCSRMIRKNKKLTPNQIKSILLKNCTPIVMNRNIEGFGLLNCEGILNDYA